ncbi:hypothetical protein SCARD494_07635 [Seiridium cardinale]
MEILYKLWEGSFRDDAVLEDYERGVYIASDAVRQIHHKGGYFEVLGPHLCEPSQQRTPFLFQAGVSEAGNGFCGKNGEAIFIGEGRDRKHITVVLGIQVIVAATDEEAYAKRDEYLKYTDRESALVLFGGWTGVDLSSYSDDEDFRLADSLRLQSIILRWAVTQRIVEYLSVGGLQAKVIGSPTTVADELERWVEISDVDGFNLTHITNPGTFEDIIDLIPELQRRGIFRRALRGKVRRQEKPT